MTNTEKLTAAGWTKIRSTQECGQAIVTRGNLYGLACGKGANWSKTGSPELCAQHALLREREIAETGHRYVGRLVEFTDKTGTVKQVRITRVERLRFPAGSLGLHLEGGGILPNTPGVAKIL